MATSDWAHTGNRQGISGLAFPSIATFLQHEPFIYSLINAGVLDEQAFEFKLINGTGSTLTLGSSNKDATWVPLIEETFWGIPASLNGFIFNGVVDSGTTLIVVSTRPLSPPCSGNITSTYTVYLRHLSERRLTTHLFAKPGALRPGVGPLQRA